MFCLAMLKNTCTLTRNNILPYWCTYNPLIALKVGKEGKVAEVHLLPVTPSSIVKVVDFFGKYLIITQIIRIILKGMHLSWHFGSYW